MCVRTTSTSKTSATARSPVDSLSSSPDQINGTFDWVYEEEFSLRDGFRWSPDGKAIAYWQLDTAGVPEFPLVNNTDSLYPRVKSIKYPKVGEKNAACRVGVVSASGGETALARCARRPPRELHRLSGMGRQLPRAGASAIQSAAEHGSRHREFRSWALEPGESAITIGCFLKDHDDAWIDLQDELRLGRPTAREFLWLSERDGWRHIYRVSRDASREDARCAASPRATST